MRVAPLTLALALACALISPLAAKAPRPLPKAGGPTPALRVLCYHRVGAEKASDPYKISPEHFEAQLKWLKTHGFQSVRLADVTGGFTRTAKPLLITFDDGHDSPWLVGAPLMKKYGFRAVFFCHPKALGRNHRLTWEMLKKAEAEGFEVGSHSQQHSNMAKPAKGEDKAAYQARLLDETAGSRKLLEDGLGHSVTAFAYPYGAWNTRTERAVREAGYTVAFTVTRGPNAPDEHPLRIKRVLLAGRPSLEAFAKAMGTEPLPAALAGLTDGQTLPQGYGPLPLTLSSTAGQALNPKMLVYCDDQFLRLKYDGPSATGLLHGGLKPGFHLLKVWDETPGGSRERQWFFQVAPKQNLKFYD